MLRFYSYGGAAAGRRLFVLGLVIAGVGVGIFVFRELLAAIVAGILVVVGAVFCVGGLRLVWLDWRARRLRDTAEPEYRENVRIRRDWRED